MQENRRQRTYDPRLIQIVRESGDVTVATRIGVPRSTAAGWLRRQGDPFLVPDGPSIASLRRELVVLQLRVRRLTALVRIAWAILRVVRPDFSNVRFSRTDRKRILDAIYRSRRALTLRRALRLFGVSPARFHAWKSEDRACEITGTATCSRKSPQRLTVEEVNCMREMVSSPEFRHVSMGQLALLAQRMGRVFASASTWCRVTRERGWRRPRLRFHPARPEVGIRSTRPDEIWHIDTTIIRLLDGTRTYLHAVIDNFSRRILAWRLSDRFDVTNTVTILHEAESKRSDRTETPIVLADAGVENVNKSVDEVVESGVLRRILAQTEIRFSNSMIEAWWRSLKHQWLYLHRLDRVDALRDLIEFYVGEYNSKLPHSAFRGQTPDEKYFGKNRDIESELAASRATAQQARLERNRGRTCSACRPVSRPGSTAA